MAAVLVVVKSGIKEPFPNSAEECLRTWIGLAMVIYGEKVEKGILQ